MFLFKNKSYKRHKYVCFTSVSPSLLSSLHTCRPMFVEAKFDKDLIVY